MFTIILPLVKWRQTYNTKGAPAHPFFSGWGSVGSQLRGTPSDPLK